METLQLMEARCSCGSPIAHVGDALGCIHCGRACCRTCGISLESATYCTICAGVLMGAPAGFPVGALKVPA